MKIDETTWVENSAHETLQGLSVDAPAAQALLAQGLSAPSRFYGRRYERGEVCPWVVGDFLRQPVRLDGRDAYVVCLVAEETLCSAHGPFHHVRAVDDCHQTVEITAAAEPATEAEVEGFFREYEHLFGRSDFLAASALDQTGFKTWCLRRVHGPNYRPEFKHSPTLALRPGSVDYRKQSVRDARLHP